MSAQIIDGKTIAAGVLDEVRADVARLRADGIVPGLACVLVGDDPASAAYVRGKTRDAAATGIESITVTPRADVDRAELHRVIDELNGDPRWHGIIVQTPLPPHLDDAEMTGAVLPHKDVDGLHPLNAGRLLRGEPALISCTPHGVVQMLMRSGHDPAGKHVVIVGRSNLVGRPLTALLLRKASGGNATVTICHTGTQQLAEHTRRADILVAAIGRPRAITADMVREGAVVIDVGVNAVPDATKKAGTRLVGDVDFDAVAEKAAAITPVPGGVGLMTRAMLLYNTVLAASGGPAGEQ